MPKSFDINQLNSLLEQASDTILCNSECQKERKAEKLKQKYLDSQTNLASAPHLVQVLGSCLRDLRAIPLLLHLASVLEGTR